MKAEQEPIEEIEDITDNKHFSYYEQMVSKRIMHFYLSNEISEPVNYITMIYKISSADPSDTIIIHINTIGGDLGTGIQIVNAIKSSQAHIICSIEGYAYSLASMIFLAGHEFIVHDNSLMLIHNETGGLYGKGNERMTEMAATVKWFNTLAKSYYVPFISEQELEAVLKDEDIWLQAADIRKRLGKMVKILNSEEKEKKPKKII